MGATCREAAFAGKPAPTPGTAYGIYTGFMSLAMSVMKISAKLAFFTLVSTLAYFALAVFGLGGLAAFFSHPPLVVIALATLVMAIVSLFSEGNLSSGEREDRANRWVLPVFGVLGLLSGYLPAYTDRIDFWTFGGEGVRWLGALLFIGGGAWRAPSSPPRPRPGVSRPARGGASGRP